MKNDKLMKLSTYITVLGVSLIIATKIYAWFVTESVTILASLVDSLLDACVSIMNLLAVHFALQPPDEEHRFGHGKAEDIAVFIQSVFFAASGIFLIGAAIERFFYPNYQIVDSSIPGIITMAFSILVTIGIISFQHYVMRRAKSNVIEADSLHYMVDFISNVIAIIGILIVSRWKLIYFDSIAAIIIAGYIIYNAIKIFRKALNNLMDCELNNEEKQIIIDLINSHDKIIGFHDLKTRYAGTKPFIQFHLELDNKLSLKQAHAIGAEIEKLLLSKIPYAEIIIHLDPDGIEEKINYKD